MAFFRPHVFSPYTAQQQQQVEPSFHGLFRLLEDWDNHHNTNSQQQAAAKRPCQHAAARCQQPVFTPRFDIQETESAYELYGELPGVQKQDINIEFSDPQTLVIRGRVERSSSSTSNTTQDGESNLLTPSSSSSSTSASSEIGEDDDNNNDEEGVLVSHGEKTAATTTTAANADAHSETASQRSLKATVEDDTEDQDASAAAIEKDTNTSREQSGANQNGTTSSTADPGSIDAEGRAKSQTTQPASKFWISERSVGTFSRTFEFPERIEIDNVSAGLENGVLSLRVPKAKKFGARQISVL